MTLPKCLFSDFYFYVKISTAILLKLCSLFFIIFVKRTFAIRFAHLKRGNAYLRSKSFFTPWIATSTPRISSNTAKISCKVFPRSRPVINNAFVSLLMVIPSAVKVTAIINTIGIQSMQPWRFVFFKNTAQATRASTDNS